MNLEGCSTQADTLPDLLVMINDALYTYFEIPQSQRSEMPRYRPRYEAIREKIVTDSPPRGRFALQLA